MAEPDSEDKISVIVKPTSAHGTVKYTLETTANASVQDLKSQLAEASNIAPAELRLIYKGQILKDDNTLASYGISNEHVIHLVRSRAVQTSSRNTPTSAAPTAAPSAPTTAPLTPPPVPGVGGLGGNFMEMMNNPEMMSQIMQLPMAQWLQDNPEMMQRMLQNNPALQQLIERNPELGAMLNDPAVIRQSLQIASNPALLREHMRHSDRALSNLEAMPEGFNALRRMFETVQEPLMAATVDMGPLGAMMGNAGAATRTSTGDSGTTTTARSTTGGAPTTGGGGGGGAAEVPNAAPLPNPWAPPTTTTAAAAGGGGGGTGVAGATGLPLPPGFEAALGLPPGFSGGPGAPDMGSLPSSEFVQEVLQQPGMRQLMSSLMSNPAYMEHIISSNPTLRQMVDSMPGFRNIISDPATMDMFLNPQFMQAMQQRQGNMGGGMRSLDASLRSGLPSSTAENGVTGAAGAAAPGGGGGTPAAPDFMNQWMQMMRMMGPLTDGAGGGGGGVGGAFGAAAVPAADPQTQYASQLSSLADMGFTDTAANVRALQATGGNVHAAVDRLLGGGV